jgi:hypothetical protein
MPYETKKYRESLLFFNEIIEKGFLNDLNIPCKDKEIKVYQIDEEFKWVVKKNYLDDFLEIRVEYHNLKYLTDNQKNMTKKEYNKRKVTKNCYVYLVEQNKPYLALGLLKSKYNKQHIQFIHNDYWFKDFRMKNEFSFTKI